MADWVITVPKTVRWEDYRREIDAVADGSSVMNYRLARAPRDLKAGDRCYVTWNGRVRGWMEVVGVRKADEAWRCTTTGATWPPGTYLQRSGPFHEADGPDLPGFRGIRRFDAPTPDRVASRWLGG